MKEYQCVFLIGVAIYLVLASAQDPTHHTTEKETNKTEIIYIRINKTCHELTYLFDLHGEFGKKIVIKHTALLRSDNVLYYSFEPKFEDREYYKVGFANLSDPKPATLSSEQLVFNFGTFDVNQANKVIYLGGSDGIYQLDMSNANLPQLQPFSSRGDTIVSLFFKGDIYFVRYGENKIVRKKGDKFFTYFEHNGTIKDFVMTQKDTVFLSSYGLFASRGGDVVRLSKNAFFRGLTVDLDGIVYAWWLDSMYKVILRDVFAKSTIVKVAEISSLGSMTFDNSNNILITLERSLFRLTPTNVTQC